MKALDIPIAAYEFGGEPVEKFRVAWVLALYPKILRGFYQPDAEQSLPESINSYACSEWVFGCNEPFRQADTVCWPLLFPTAYDCGDCGGEGFRFVRVIILTPVENIGGSWFQAVRA